MPTSLQAYNSQLNKQTETQEKKNGNFTQISMFSAIAELRSLILEKNNNFFFPFGSERTKKQTVQPLCNHIDILRNSRTQLTKSNKEIATQEKK